MFKGLGTWLGLENPTYAKTLDDKEKLSVEQEEKVVEAQNEVNKQQPADQDGEPEASQENSENSENSKGLGGEEEPLSVNDCCCWERSQYNVMLGNLTCFCQWQEEREVSLPLLTPHKPIKSVECPHAHVSQVWPSALWLVAQSQQEDD